MRCITSVDNLWLSISVKNLVEKGAKSFLVLFIKNQLNVILDPRIWKTTLVKTTVETKLLDLI